MAQGGGVPEEGALPKLSGIDQQRAVKAIQKPGFSIVREGKHITMTNGERIITIPRANPVDALKMAGIEKDTVLTRRVQKITTAADNKSFQRTDSPPLISVNKTFVKPLIACPFMV